VKACSPEIVLRRARPGCKVSVILIDWGVRESFHGVEYLNRQTVPRSDYELIWLEFYNRKPDKLRKIVESGVDGLPPLDQWITAGYGDDGIYSKHRLYNIGILAAQGEICVICDSDAIFTPTFIEKIIQAFNDTPRAVIHLDEIRNNDHSFFPFRYPTLDEVKGKGCINWQGAISVGLDNHPDKLHKANYGACMAAKRADLIAVGGSDEHLDYLGYVCGPYELTFRLMNYGLEERWLLDEYLYHTWHPNENSINTEYHGPHDGRFMSLRALEALADRRVLPCLENPWIARTRNGERLELEEVLTLAADKEEPEWRNGDQPTSWDGVYWMERDFEGFNIYVHKDRWYGLKAREGAFNPRRAWRYRVLIEAESHERVRQEIHYYNELPTGLWDRMWVQPPHRLPLRVWRRLTKEVARLF
jgi:glycosyltransferase involved in cell wall biosynthesis